MIKKLKQPGLIGISMLNSTIRCMALSCPNSLSHQTYCFSYKTTLQHNCSILYDCSILFQDCSIPIDCSILQDCSNLKNLYILHNCSIPLLSLVVGKTFIIGEFQGPKTLQSGPIFQVPKTLLSGDFQGSKTLLSGDGIYMSPPVVQEAMIKISYIHGIFHSSKTPPPPQL